MAKIKKHIFFILLVLFLINISACASLKPIPQARKATQISHRPKALSDQERARLTSTAKKFIGKSELKVGNTKFRSDCSGAIRAIFAAAKLRLGGIIKNYSDNDVKTIYRYVRKYGQIIKQNPAPGDLVFFHNTYNRSRSGRMNDALTHIGIVEKIEGSTVHFIHHLGHSIIRSRLNLSSPRSSHDAQNMRINTYLRKAEPGRRSYTAGELFAGFGRL